jgi:shikimate kinase
MAKPQINIVLIGMPGSGKSTIGSMLSKSLSMDFMDTDILIQNREGRSLQEIVDSDGPMGLRMAEERALLNIDCNNNIIATGGSAVYSHDAMRHLGANGVIVFLDVNLVALKSRIDNYELRGLAKQPGQTLEELFMERFHLYRKYAQVTIDCNALTTQDEVCKAIIKELKRMEFL